MVLFALPSHPAKLRSYLLTYDFALGRPNRGLSFSSRLSPGPRGTQSLRVGFGAAEIEGFRRLQPSVDAVL